MPSCPALRIEKDRIKLLPTVWGQGQKYAPLLSEFKVIITTLQQ